MEQPVRLRKLDIQPDVLTLDSMQQAINRLLHGNEILEGEIVEPLKALPEPTKLDKQIAAAKKYKI